MKANPTGNKENSAKEGTDFLRGKGGVGGGGMFEGKGKFVNAWAE